MNHLWYLVPDDTDKENLPTIDTLSPPVVKGTKNTNKTNERKPTNNQRKPRTNKNLFIQYQTNEDIEQFSSQEEETITSYQKKTPKQNDTNKKSPFASLTSTSTITMASLPKIPKRKPASTVTHPSATTPKPTATTAKSTATAPKPTATAPKPTITTQPTTQPTNQPTNHRQL